MYGKLERPGVWEGHELKVSLPFFLSPRPQAACFSVLLLCAGNSTKRLNIMLGIMEEKEIAAVQSLLLWTLESSFPEDADYPLSTPHSPLKRLVFSCF